MAATKTKLNSKLPTVSKIAFCSSAGKDMRHTIRTGENGKFSVKVGFKQTSKTYPFQIQYRQRSRYTNANTKIKGAAWTKWSNWKAAVGVSGIPKDGTQSDYPVNGWLKANKGVNKKATYQTFYTFTEYQIPSLYDARQFQFRVRTINKSKAKHGNWTTQTLSVFKRAAVVDETIITAVSGGMKIKFNYIWDRDCTIKVNSIKDRNGRELLKKSYTAGLGVATLTSQTIPASRPGYQGGQVDIGMERLKRKIVAGESLTLDVSFVTVDGTATKLKSGTVIEPLAALPITTSTKWDELKGVYTVMATSGTNLNDIGCSISYIYNNKQYSIAPVKKEIDLNGTSTFYFYPPIGIDITPTVKAEDSLDNKDYRTLTTTTLRANGYRFNKVDDIDMVGIAWGEASYQISSQPVFETSLPYGREYNVIFYGEGNTNELSFSATIVDKEGCYGAQYQRKLAWNTISNNQGIYVFRSSKGDMYKVGLKKVQLQSNKNNLYQLSVDMVEVV